MPLGKEVLNTSESISDFNVQRISNSIFDEVNYVASIFDLEQQITQKESDDVAKRVAAHIASLNGNLKILTGPLIREMVCGELTGRKRDFYTRVGLSIADAFRIDNASSDVTHDNANQTKNAETKHKQKADQVAKEQALLTIPQHLSLAHMEADIHIHDLEYFTTRTFCIDGKTVVPVRNGNNISAMKLNDVPFSDDEYNPKGLCAFTPMGWRGIIKVTRRKAEEDEMLMIRTSSGKSIKVTKDHRIPISTGQMQIRKASELEIGNILYNAASSENFDIRGDQIESIDLIKELTEKVPMALLDKIYVRNLRGIFDNLSLSQSKLVKSLEALGVNDFESRTEESWFDRGIMPLSVFKKFVEHYDVKELDEVRIGVVGSKHSLPSNFPITSELVKILGYFVSEGNYNNGNLVITGDDFVSDVQSWSKKVFNSYATISESDEKITNIVGLEREWKRSKQVLFGGLLAVFIFKYVFGIPEGSVNKRLPNIVYNLSDEALRDFLSALFSGDGSAYYRAEKSDCTVSYATTSEVLRQELSLLLTSLGMNPSITKVPREEHNDLHRVLISGRKNVSIFNDWIEFNDESNRQHIESFLSNVSETSTNNIEKIKEITPIESSGEYVYDIFLERGESEEYHTFFASDGLLIHNCMDWDLRFFFYYGLDPDCTGKTNIATAAMQPTVALLHAAKILGSAQTNFAGGQGFYNFIPFIAPYLEGLPYKEIKQLMQMFIFEISQTMVARGAQVVFSSVQLAPGIPNLWKDKPAVYKGVVWNGENGNEHRPYGNFEKEARLAFRALMEVMHKGDAWGKLFNFPKPEIAFEREFMADHEDDKYYERREAAKLTDVEAETPMTYSELYDLVMALTIKFGTPYYDNMLPEYRQSDGISCYQCQAGDTATLVMTSDGNIKFTTMEELFEEFSEEKTYGWNNLKSLISVHTREKWVPVKRLLKVSGNDSVTIKTSHGYEIETTPDHPFITESGKVNAINLSTNHKLKICDSIETNETAEISPEIAWLLGYWTGDGYFYNKNNVYFVFDPTCDEDKIRKVHKIIHENFNVKYTKERRVIDRNGIYIWFNSPELKTFMEGLGMRTGSGYKEIPNIVFNAKKESKIAFYNGVVDSDGHVRNDGYSRAIQILTTSERLGKQLQYLAKMIGFDIEFVKQIRNKTNLCDTPKPLYRINTMNQSNSKIAMDILGRDYDISQRKNSLSKPEEFYKINEITSNSYTLEKDFFDLEVDDESHEFMAGHTIVSGNCCAFAFSAGADTKNFDDKMYFRNGEHFSMGSNHVISVNTPRAAYRVPKGDFDALEAECQRLIMQAIEVLKFKRDWIKKLWYNGHIPFATQQLRHPVTKEVSPPAVDYEELVYTIGVVGMNEVSLHHTGYGLDNDIGLKLSIKLLNRLTDFVNKQSEERDIKLVLARTPAESAAQRFAVSDLIAFPEEATPCIQGDVESALANLSKSRNLPIYYSNGTHLPVNTKAGIIDRMKREGKFFHVLDGGNIFHVWMGEEDPDPVALKEFIFNILNNTEIGYFTFTKDFSICEPCGKQMNGIKTVCDRCGSDDVKAYSRITGYIQDVSGWNAAKLQELKERTRTRVI